MSNYINIGESQGFEWNIVPLNIYLYGVEDPRFRPLFGSYAVKNLLEERYRAKYLQRYCDGPPCSTSSKAEWREMVGARSESTRLNSSHSQISYAVFCLNKKQTSTIH